MKNELSIIIPTYNRAPFLNQSLEILSSYIAKGLCFDLIICDNGSTDNTLHVIEEWKACFSDVVVVIHPENMGYDYNLISGYQEVKTNYCWVLGDSYSISFKVLESVINHLLTNNIDALIIKCKSEMLSDSKCYYDINQLLDEQGWHITNLSSCVIRRDFIDSRVLKRYQNTNFIHLGVFVEYLCSLSHFKVLYDNNLRLETLCVPGFVKKNWTSAPFGIFGKLWYMTVMSLPNQIDLELKEKILLDHNKYTSIFSLKRVLKGKKNKGYLEDYRKNRKYIKHVISSNILYYDIIMYLIPSFFIKRINIAVVRYKIWK